MLTGEFYHTFAFDGQARQRRQSSRYVSFCVGYFWHTLILIIDTLPSIFTKGHLYIYSALNSLSIFIDNYYRYKRFYFLYVIVVKIQQGLYSEKCDCSKHNQARQSTYQGPSCFHNRVLVMGMSIHENIHTWDYSP